MNKTTLRNLHKLCLFTCSLQNVITTFFVRHECGQVQGLGRPKRSTRKRIVYQFCSKIYDHMNKWALQTFREWQDQKRSRFAPFSQADCSKVKTWGGCSRVDWKHWNHECQKSKLLAVGCQWVENKSGRRYSSRTLYSIVRLRLKTFPGNFDWFWKISFALFVQFCISGCNFL